MDTDTLEFTGKHIKSQVDLERMIKEAKWQVDFYKKQVQKAQDELYVRELGLESLQIELDDINDNQLFKVLLSSWPY